MIKILTDSTANLPKSIVEQYDIEVLPTYVHFGDETYMDGVELTAEQFYKKLVEYSELPTTSQIPVADFEAAYRRVHEKYPDASIISLHVSSALSGIIESARSAAAKLPDVNIRIFDTLSIGVGCGLMINRAARMAHDSKSMEDILKRLEAMRDGTQVYTALDTLDYLAKSGRIGRAARLMGTVLDIKPILTLKNGAIDAFDRQRSRPRALATLRDLAVKACKGRTGAHVGIMHAACQDDARKMADELRAELNPEVLIIGDIGPSVGVYVGPGAIGVAWYASPQ